MKFAEDKLASALHHADLWPNVRATILDRKRSLEARVAALRGAPAEMLLAIAEALDQAGEAPKTKRVATKHVKVTKPLVHHGDLVFAGSVTVTSALFVTGNLTVKGVLADYDPDGYMGIAGDVHVGHMLTSGAVGCGDLFAKGLVYGEHNDHSLVCGTIQARVVVSDQHDMQHAGVLADLYLDVDQYAGGYDKRATKRMQEQFVAGMFERDENEGVDVFSAGKAFAALRAGKSVFRPRKGPPKKRRIRY